MVFVNSMSDLFHKDVPDEYIVLVARIMVKADWHTYQVLTKRSDRLLTLLQTKLAFAAKCDHIWWGVSVENQKHGLPRIAHLREAAPSMTFLSVEPLLEDLGDVDLSGIDWVIVGGESGPGARPMAKEWVERLLFQCEKAQLTFFFKQWGGVRKKLAGRILNNRTYDDHPTLSANPMATAISRKGMIAEFQNTWPTRIQLAIRRTA